MRKYILTLVIVVFYIIGLLQVVLGINTIIIPIVVGLCAGALAGYIDEKIK